MGLSLNIAGTFPDADSEQLFITDVEALVAKYGPQLESATMTTDFHGAPTLPVGPAAPPVTPPPVVPPTPPVVPPSTPPVTDPAVLARITALEASVATLQTSVTALTTWATGIAALPAP
jgi:hypothetical protein